MKQSLYALGFSEREATIYLALLTLGASKSIELARYTGYTRPTIYDVVEKLIHKGVISKYKKRNITFFNAQDPQKLIEYLERELVEVDTRLKNQKRQMQELLPVLQSLSRSNTTRPKVQFFEGEKGMREAYEDTLTTKDKILAYTNVEEMVKVFPNFFPAYFQRRAAKRIPTDAIFVNNAAGQERASHDLTELRRTKFLPDPADIWYPEVKVYDDKVLITSWREKIAVIIQSREYADLQRVIFQALWEKLDE
ncbi:MAG: hypothetical protein HY817_05460 [Candidatus Abawacabacteria bacterium]|nr:hypothetical protein [Candidatus Abawacabacteria bacterium]